MICRYQVRKKVIENWLKENKKGIDVLLLAYYSRVSVQTVARILKGRCVTRRIALAISNIMEMKLEIVFKEKII